MSEHWVLQFGGETYSLSKIFGTEKEAVYDAKEKTKLTGKQHTVVAPIVSFALPSKIEEYKYG